MRHTAPHPRPPRTFRKEISLGQLILLAIGGQIGSAWLFAVLSAAGVSGPAAILSWLAAGAIFMVMCLPWMELGAMAPTAGSVVRYPSLTHGALTGWLMGWSGWLMAVTIPALEAVAVCTYIGSKFTGLDLIQMSHGTTLLRWPNGISLAIALMAVFLLINIAGVRFLSHSTKWITLVKIAVPTIAFILLLTSSHGENFSAFGGFAPFGVGSILHAIPVTGIAFAFIGFRQALDFGAEIKNPQRHLPLAALASIIVPTVLYALLQVAFVGAIDWKNAGLSPGNWAGLASSTWGGAPFLHAFDAAGGALFIGFGNVLLIDAVISPSGAGWIYTGNSGRVAFALGKEGYVPRLFQRLGTQGVPTASLVASFIVGCVFFIPAPSWYMLVSFVSSAGVLTFLMGSVSLAVLRRSDSTASRPFRLKTAQLWSPAAFLCSTLVIYWAGFDTINNLIVIVFLAVAGYSGFIAQRRGWLSPRRGAAISAGFLACWGWVIFRSGWFLSTPGSPPHWSFPVYYLSLVAVVAAFCAALWVLSNRAGRVDLMRGGWLLGLLAVLPLLSYLGAYGPLRTPVLRNPIDLLVVGALALAAYYAAVTTGRRDAMLSSIMAGDSRGETAPGDRAGLYAPIAEEVGTSRDEGIEISGDTA